jgi:hypothetical protein
MCQAEGDRLEHDEFRFTFHQQRVQASNDSRARAVGPLIETFRRSSDRHQPVREWSAVPAGYGRLTRLPSLRFNGRNVSSFGTWHLLLLRRPRILLPQLGEPAKPLCGSASFHVPLHFPLSGPKIVERQGQDLSARHNVCHPQTSKRRTALFGRAFRRPSPRPRGVGTAAPQRRGRW